MSQVARDDEEAHERFSTQLLERLDRPMAALGVVFLLLVLADTVVAPESPTARVLGIAGWVVWAVFAAEFVLRLASAPNRRRFLARNWWQLVFLALPFLRFVRVLRVALRAARAGRVVSSAVRTSRSAGRRLADRASWLAVVTLIVVLSSAQLLYQLADVPSFADALHGAALATITGEGIAAARGGFARVLEVVLAAYSVIVFATFAAIIGAYLLDERAASKQPSEPS